ncbi:MAG: BamA/TamA family outer membrane protein [Calditrichaeota bacterium]|nr:BamA/TamA family outer membrane protein [Calditrichota bacterium]
MRKPVGSQLILLTCLLSAAAICLGGTKDTQRLKIGSLRFAGTHAFSATQLRRIVVSRPTSFFRRSYFFPEVFQEDVKTVELFYRQRGYLQAQVTGHLARVDSARRMVDLEIHVQEGELTRVEGVSVFENRVFSDEVLLGRIDIRAGEPFQANKVEAATLSLLTFYANNGYLDAEVTPEVRLDDESHRALIDFRVRAKARCTIDQVRLVGLEKTQPKVVLRELDFKTGNVVEYARLLSSQRKLYLTGLFRGVFVRPQPATSGDSTRRDILVDLKENESGEFTVAFGYESVERWRGRVEIANTNWRGTARKFALATHASFVNRGLELSFTEPWTFGTRLRTDINILAEQLQEPGFDIRRVANTVRLGRPYAARSSVVLTFKNEVAELSHIRVTVTPERKRTVIRGLKLTAVHDTRDNMFNPTSGVLLEWSNEFAGLVLRGTDSFVRSSFRAKLFRPVGASTVIATAAELGWIDTPGGLPKIPLHERFYTGGPNSLRGLAYRKAGPLDARGLPLGGRLKVVINALELRQAVYKMVGGVVFAEAGNVWSAPQQFKLSELRPTVGVGLRLNTPIGLARLDYGANVDRRGGERKGMLYFSMGHAF